MTTTTATIATITTPPIIPAMAMGITGLVRVVEEEEDALPEPVMLALELEIDPEPALLCTVPEDVTFRAVITGTGCDVESELR